MSVLAVSVITCMRTGEVEEEKENEVRGPALWWHEFVKDEDLEIMGHSNKLVMLFSILRECEAIGDKV
jgi:transcriptional regulator ATRX